MNNTGNAFGYDGTFELNNFAQPKLSSEIETVINTLLYVLFSKPGQYPSLPHIGLDIENMLYSFYKDINPGDLSNAIISQCADLDVYISTGMIQIQKKMYRNKPSLIISVNGTATYPDNGQYLTDRTNKQYMIGITFNDLNKMIYDVAVQ